MFAGPSRQPPFDSHSPFMEWWKNRGGQQFQLLFDQIDSIFFFAKDAESRIVAISEPLARRFVQRLGLQSTDQICGLTDYDLHPKDIADRFVADDQVVMTTGKPLLGRLEMWYNQDNELAWSFTTKVPIRDADGSVIGLIGTIRNHNWKEINAQQSSLVNAVVSYIQKHHQQRVIVDDIAREMKLSVRHLNRQFRQVFSMSVQEFLIQQRLQTVKTSLAHTDTPISQIAAEAGFYDQSSMTKLFQKYLGMTPLKYRKRYRQPD